MPDSIGTRVRQNMPLENAAQGADTRTRNADVGMKKRVNSNSTFTAANGRITGANGDYSNFAVQDRIQVQGANLNNGFFDVVAIDAVNGAYVQVAPPPKNEGPIAVVVRAA